MRRFFYAAAAALALGLVVTTTGCPAAHTDYPGQSCMTDSDCFQGEHCMNNTICVADAPDMAVELGDLAHILPGSDLAGSGPDDMMSGDAL